jgi:hypothetical protein
MESAGKRFSTIGFGSDYSRIEVHPDFKFILICHLTDVLTMDPPLLNRFEKQEYITRELINKD